LTVSATKKALPVVPHTRYKAQIRFDGLYFHILRDGIEVMNVPSFAYLWRGIPGFKVHGGFGAFGAIQRLVIVP